MNGVGVVGIVIVKFLLFLGVKNLIVCDKVGILYRGMEKIDDVKEVLVEIINLDNIKGSFLDVLVDVDLFVGVFVLGILKFEMVKLMNRDVIIFVMVNLILEIMFDEVKVVGVRVIGIGCLDFFN